MKVTCGKSLAVAKTSAIGSTSAKVLMTATRAFPSEPIVPVGRLRDGTPSARKNPLAFQLCRMFCASILEESVTFARRVKKRSRGNVQRHSRLEKGDGWQSIAKDDRCFVDRVFPGSSHQSVTTRGAKIGGDCTSTTSGCSRSRRCQVFQPCIR